jgi:hypothetical protein
MPRRPSTFRETDIKRALRAVRAAGIQDARLEIEPVTGRITIMTGSNSDPEKITDLDTWIGNHANQA